MVELLQEIRDEYELYAQCPTEYEKKVNSISNMLGLTRKNRLKSNYCAVYLVGKYQKAPIVMFGVNPGYSAKNSPLEEREARKSWEGYQHLYLNFFQYMSDNSFESPYYTALWYLLSGLTASSITKEKKWDLFDQYLCNVELIPYHSEGMVLPAVLNEQQFTYIQDRYASNINFIKQFRPKLLIFNGNVWKILLINHDLVKEYVRIPITNQFTIYFFESDGIPSVLFNRFFQRHFWGITNDDRMFTIPKLIHNKFQNLCNELSVN